MTGITPAAEFYARLAHAVGTGGNAPVYHHYGVVHSYDDLDRTMRAFNSALSKHRRKAVVVHSGKGFPAYAAIFAVLLSGNTWVPLNPEIPEARMIDMLRLSQPALILTDRTLPAALAAWAEQNGIAVADLDDLAAGPETPFALAGFDDDDVAYVMYTSGSTGVPKGVPVTHRNYVSFVDNAMALLPLRQGDVFADYHDFGFDISVFYLFCAVLVQGCFAPGVEERDRLMPIGHLRAHNVTVLASVPSIVARMRLLHRSGRLDSRLRVLFLCGEPFRLDILRYCLDCIQALHVYNFYGLTETGVENFWHTCSAADLDEYHDLGFVPIGQPLPRTRARLTPEGELLLAGPQLTPGYLGGVGAERFFDENGERWYRTGDRVVFEKGQYFCKGRLDSQVKVNGFRVELMDIEANLRRLDRVVDAVCFVYGHDERAFIVAAIQSSAPVDTAEIQASLSAILPAHMVPRAVMSVAEMPLNKNGKIDRPRVCTMWKDSAQ